jgi:TonB-linked SusC/RagA family outer membrane protein
MGLTAARAQEWASTRPAAPLRLMPQDSFISLRVENEPLNEILKKIERQTGYGFVYGADLVRSVRRSLNVERQPLSTVLDALLPEGLRYQIRDRQVILTRQAAEPVDRELRGRIADATTGEGLPGASLVIKNTTRGVTSGADGTYRLAVPDGAVTLLVSSVGYLPQEIVVGAGQTALDVRLQQDTRNLDEVQVVAFGEQRRRDVTGSISTLKAADIQANTAFSPDVALQGRAAGVQITQAGGTPGGAVRINIRGVASLNSDSQPLIVIDGVPIVNDAFGTAGVAMNPLAEINPNDIESMEVLKDASASVLYGSRAANGVILITTKKGSRGKPRLELNYQEGVNTLPRRVPYVDNGADLFGILKFTSNRTLPAGLPIAPSRLVNIVPGGILGNPLPAYPGDIRTDSATLYSTRTDWLDQVLRTGTFRQAGLTFSGATKKLNYLVSGNYRNDNGVVVGQSLERVGGRVKLDYTVFRGLKVGLNATINFLTNNGINANSGFGLVLTRALPALPIYASDGSYFNDINYNGNVINQGSNPLFYRENSLNRTETVRTINQAFLEYQPIKGLVLRSEIGFDYQQNDNINLQTPALYPADIQGQEISGNGRVETRDFRGTNLNVNNIASYTRELGKHRLTGLLGNQILSSVDRSDIYIAENLIDGTQIGIDTTRVIPQRDVPAYRFLSFFGRLNYAFRDRYLLEASYRVDGSSRFGPGRQWASFPSVSAGWILSEESFLKQLPGLTFLKLRASYGLTGNAEIGNFSWQKRFTYVGYNAAKYGGIQGGQFTNPGNEVLSWESTTQFSTAVEFNLWQGRLSGSFEYYNKLSDGLLLNYSLGPYFGTINNSMTVNLGLVRNRGLELTLSSRLINRAKFSWTADFNIARNKNLVLSTYSASFLNFPSQIIAGPNIATPGYPLGTYYLNRFMGFDPNTGNELFLERDRIVYANTGQTVSTGNLWDGTISNQSGQNQFILPDKSPYPQFFGGLTNSVRVGAFAVSALVYFQYGNWIYDQGERVGAYPFTGVNMRLNVPGLGNVVEELNKPEGGNLVRTVRNSQARNFESTRFLHNGSFARLKNVQVAYTVPSALSQRLRMSRVQLILTGQNLLTATNFNGWDPEVFRNGGADEVTSNLGPGVTSNDLPQVRSYVLTLNVSF